MGDFVSIHTPIFTDVVTPRTGGRVSQDAGGIFNISSNTQDPRISPVMSKELRQLRDMISTIPGVIQAIPEVSPFYHENH